MRSDGKSFQTPTDFVCNSNMAENSMGHVNDISDGVDNMALEEQSSNVAGAVQSGFRDGEDVPRILIATNLNESIFESEECKVDFESFFRTFDINCQIQYLRSFHRARIEYDSGMTASKARIQLHETMVLGKRLKLYFAQPLTVRQEESSPHLQIPALTKQFLISPPASPPVGWSPIRESEPVINYDLISALAHLAPGESHELHPATAMQPGIIVHICEDPEGYDQRPPIAQTRRPDFG